MIRTVLLVALASAVAFLVRYGSEVVPIAPKGSPGSITPPLGTPGYDIHELDAPTATGNLLKGLAAILTHPYSPIGPVLRRTLLNTNGLHKVLPLRS